jgi:electron transfer flavoprotein alpha/beta subunit
LAERVADKVAAKIGENIAVAAATAPAEAVAAAPPAIAAKSEPAWEARPVTAAELPAYEVPAKDGPRILVAVKHVAELGEEFAFAPDQMSIADEYFEYALNEWDDAALEEALQITERVGAGEVVAVTIGPESAEDTLRKVLAKGAHRGVRVWHESLASADPVTVARALAGVARQEQPELILTGVQSNDLAHGATGVALARILELPHAAVVIGLEWDGGETMTLARELEGGVRHRIELPAPALLTIQTGINKPRYATMRMIKQAKQKRIDVLDGGAVGLDQAGATLRRIYEPPKTGRAQMLDGSAAEIAGKIAEIIRDKRGD